MKTFDSALFATVYNELQTDNLIKEIELRNDVDTKRHVDRLVADIPEEVYASASTMEEAVEMISEWCDEKFQDVSYGIAGDHDRTTSTLLKGVVVSREYLQREYAPVVEEVSETVLKTIDEELIKQGFDVLVSSEKPMFNEFSFEAIENTVSTKEGVIDHLTDFFGSKIEKIDRFKLDAYFVKLSTHEMHDEKFSPLTKEIANVVCNEKSVMYDTNFEAVDFVWSLMMDPARMQEELQYLKRTFKEASFKTTKHFNDYALKMHRGIDLVRNNFINLMLTPREETVLADRITVCENMMFAVAGYLHMQRENFHKDMLLLDETTVQKEMYEEFKSNGYTDEQLRAHRTIVLKGAVIPNAGIPMETIVTAIPSTTKAKLAHDEEVQRNAAILKGKVGMNTFRYQMIKYFRDNSAKYRRANDTDYMYNERINNVVERTSLRIARNEAIEDVTYDCILEMTGATTSVIGLYHKNVTDSVKTLLSNGVADLNEEHMKFAAARATAMTSAHFMKNLTVKK